jgi:predicted NUDIX family NTP pyrophosphohydrolase
MTISIDRLVSLYEAAKAEEEKASESRRAVGELIAAALRADRPADFEGAVSESVSGGRKVTVTYGLTRKVDSVAVMAGFEMMRPEVRGAFRFKAEIDVAAYRKLGDGFSQEAGKYITTKPSAPSIKIS